MEEEIGGVLGLHSHCYVKEEEEVGRGEETDDGWWVREAGGDGEENFHSWF